MTDSPASPQAQLRAAREGLPLRWRAAILALSVAQFLFLHGRVWQRQFDWDRSILWSYASIPLLVLVALAIRGRIRPLWLFLHTIEIGCAKFAATALILLAVLIATRNAPLPAHPPSPEVAPAPTRPPVPPNPARARAPIDPASLHDIAGRVVDAKGEPVQAAIVFISTGLEAYGFAPPQSPLKLENDGTGFLPARSVAQMGQPLLARSTDGRLHTLVLKATSGTWVRNFTLLAAGTWNPLPSREMQGLFSLRCAIHETEQRRAYLGIFDHPFVALAQPDGRFLLRGVPRAARSVAAFDAAGGKLAGEATIPQSDVDVTIRLSPL